MRDQIKYEFVICTHDGDDIVDHSFHDNLQSLIDSLPNFEGEQISLEIWRNVGNDSDGLLDRQYLAIVPGETLGVEFCGGAIVPKSISRQFTLKRLDRLELCMAHLRLFVG